MKRRAALFVTLLALLTPATGAAALDFARVSSRASALPAVKRLLHEHPHAYAAVTHSAATGWQISYIVGRTTLLEVAYANDGQLLGAYTGFKIAWQMARGDPGAFGGELDALYIWIPLSLLFVAPFVDWRHPRRMINVDLLALSAFSVSFAFFNRADIYASVPLTYPPMLYLLGRLLWLARPARAPGSSLHLNVPIRWLTVALVCIVGGRIALNVAASNVIDVGYANVVGAKRIELAKPLYGSFPSQVSNGDTYGPVSYEAYVPFVELFGTGTYDRDVVPAANAAAIVFDLVCIVLLFLIGRQIRGPGLGVVFAYAWAAYPFTALTLESNSNDGLVAALILAALLFASSPAKRGAFAALAGLAKFAPLAIAPLLLTHRLREDRGRGLIAFAAAFVLVAVVVSEPGYVHDSLSTIYSRTIGYQASRQTPFSIWGLYGHLGQWQTAVQIIALALAVAVALVPRRPDVVGLAACAGAVLIAVELGASYWFYLYIPWFFAPAVLALFAGDEQLLDGISAKRLRTRYEHTHQPGVLVGGL
jgi:hypothetical protein